MEKNDTEPGSAGRSAAFPPEEAARRKAIAEQIAAICARAVPPPEDAGKSEDEIMDEILDDITEYRRERRSARA